MIENAELGPPQTLIMTFHSALGLLGKPGIPIHISFLRVCGACGICKRNRGAGTGGGGAEVRPGGRRRGGRHTHRGAPCRVERSGRRTPQHKSRKGAEPRRSFGFIGKTVKTWAAQGPVWDSSIAREAGSTKDASSDAVIDGMRCASLPALGEVDRFIIFPCVGRHERK